MLNRMWKLVNDRLNYLTPTIKPIGYASSADGRRRRLYDAPQTPLDRPLAARVLSAAQQADLITYRDSLNPPPRSAAKSPTCRTDSSSWPRRKPSSSTSLTSPPPYPTSTKAS